MRVLGGSPSEKNLLYARGAQPIHREVIYMIFVCEFDVNLYSGNRL